MRRSVEILLYGRFPEGAEGIPGKLKLAHPVPLIKLLESLGIPINSVQLVMINNRAVQRDAMICPGDRMSIFGQEYPIFADWLSQKL